MTTDSFLGNKLYNNNTAISKQSPTKPSPKKLHRSKRVRNKQKATLLSDLIPLYCRQFNYLQKTYEKLLNDFPNKLPLNPTGNDAYDIKCNAVPHQRKIAFALLHIAKRMPRICLIFIALIWKQKRII